MLCERLKSLSDDEQQLAIDILLKNAGGLTKIQDLADMVLDTIDKLAQEPYADKKKILSRVIQILHYHGEKFPQEVRQRWEQIRDRLTGNDFPSLIKRYVGLNLFEDTYDEQGNLLAQTQLRIEELAQKALTDTHHLKLELNWLVTTEAKNGYQFGYALGKKDTKFSLLPMIIEAQKNVEKNASVYFLGGYFHALSEQD